MFHNGITNSNLTILSSTITYVNDKRRKLEMIMFLRLAHLLRSTTKPHIRLLNNVDQVAVAVVVAVVAGSPSRPTGENISMSDEETIFESYPLPE